MATIIQNKAKQAVFYIEAYNRRNLRRPLSDRGITQWVNRRWPELDQEIRKQIIECVLTSPKS